MVASSGDHSTSAPGKFWSTAVRDDNTALGDRVDIGLRWPQRNALANDRLKDDRMSVRLTERPSLGRGLMRAAVALAYFIVFAPVFMIVVTSFFPNRSSVSHPRA
jgi:hypothetical protein